MVSLQHACALTLQAPVACKLRNVNWLMTSHLDYCLDYVNSYLFYGETQSWTLQLPFLGSTCQYRSRKQFSIKLQYFPCMYNVEQRPSMKWLSGNRLPNACAIQSDARFSWFVLMLTLRNCSRLLQYFILRWWLQFRSLLGSASRKKLKLLLYQHVYLESRLCRVDLPVEHLQATVMAYSSLESKIVCSVCSGKVGKPAVEYSTVQPLLLLRAKGLRLHIYQNTNKASS